MTKTLEAGNAVSVVSPSPIQLLSTASRQLRQLADNPHHRRYESSALVETWVAAAALADRRHSANGRPAASAATRAPTKASPAPWVLTSVTGSAGRITGASPRRIPARPSPPAV